MSHLQQFWSDVEVAGHTAELFVPPRRHPQGFVLLYLHGVHLGSLRTSDAFNRLLHEHGLAAVCPRTGRSWWADRICPDFDPAVTPERYVLDAVLPFIERELSAAPRRIGLLGTSMGGQGALRLAFKHPETFPVVAAIAPAIDFHLRLREGDEVLQAMYRDVEDARQDTAILHVHPLRWPRHIWFCCDPLDERWFDGSDRLHMKLASMGMPHACDLETSAGGHGWAYYEHMAPAAIEHLVQGLEQERRRLV